VPIKKKSDDIGGKIGPSAHVTGFRWNLMFFSQCQHQKTWILSLAQIYIHARKCNVRSKRVLQLLTRLTPERAIASPRLNFAHLIQIHFNPIPYKNTWHTTQAFKLRISMHTGAVLYSDVYHYYWFVMGFIKLRKRVALIRATFNLRLRAFPSIDRLACRIPLADSCSGSLPTFRCGPSFIVIVIAKSDSMAPIMASLIGRATPHLSYSIN